MEDCNHCRSGHILESAIISRAQKAQGAWFSIKMQSMYDPKQPFVWRLLLLSRWRVAGVNNDGRLDMAPPLPAMDPRPPPLVPAVAVVAELPVPGRLSDTELRCTFAVRLLLPLLLILEIGPILETNPASPRSATFSDVCCPAARPCPCPLPPLPPKVDSLFLISARAWIKSPVST